MKIIVCETGYPPVPEIVLMLLIVFGLIYYFFLILGFKRSDPNIATRFGLASSTAACAVRITAGVAIFIAVIAIVVVDAVVVDAPAVILISLVAIAVSLIIDVVPTLCSAENVEDEVKGEEGRGKRLMLISSFAYYILMLLSYCALSDIQSTATPAIIMPIVFALTWKLVKYKN